MKVLELNRADRAGASILRLALTHWRDAIKLGTFGAALVYLSYIVLAGKFGWDFAIYRAGIEAYLATGNPYDQSVLNSYGVEMPFTYPPIIVLIFSKISWLFENPLALGVLMILHAAAVVIIPRLLISPIYAHSFPPPFGRGWGRDGNKRQRALQSPLPNPPPEGEGIRRADFFWMFGVYLVALGFSGAKLFASGNIAALLMCACLLALVYSIRTRNYLPLWITLFVLCQIKIYLIIFAIVPFLVDRKIWQPALLGALVLAGASLNYVLAPELAAGFAKTMAMFSKAPGYIGISVLEAVQIALDEMHFAPNLVAPIAFAVHALYSAIVLAFAALVLWSRARPKEAHLIFLWALMAAFLVSPRLIENDLAIMVIPFLVLLLKLVQSRGPGLIVAVIGFVIGASLIKTPLADWSGLVALAGVWLGTGLTWIAESQTPGEVRKAAAKTEFATAEPVH